VLWPAVVTGLATVTSWTVAGTLSNSKNMTISNAGGRPLPQPGIWLVVPPADVTGATSGRSDLDRLTRETPSTVRRRERSVATAR
jgi:hypothetical protein